MMMASGSRFSVFRGRRPFRHPLDTGGARMLDVPGLNRYIEMYARSKLSISNDVELPSTTLPMPPISSEVDNALQADLTSTSQSSEIDEKEALRRKRISMANSGKVPWNLGKRHSPETIEKIREKSMEAMKRPDVAENFRRSIELRVQTHSPEIRAKISEKLKESRAKKRVMLGLPTLEELEQQKQEKRLEREKEKAREKEEKEEAKRLMAENIKAQKEALKQMKDQEGPKKRVSNSEEHKKAISEAIRAKWRDPEYRELAVRRMKEVKMARAATEGTQASPKRTSGGQSASSSLSQQRKNSSKKNQEMIHQIQGIVNQLLASRQLLSNMDVKIIEMRGQADAFLNDPIMSSRLDNLLREIQMRRNELLVSVESLEAKIPTGFTFDEEGRVFSNPLLKMDDRGSQETTSTRRSPKRSTVASEASLSSSSAPGFARTRVSRLDKDEGKTVGEEPTQLRAARRAAKKTAWDVRDSH